MGPLHPFGGSSGESRQPVEGGGAVATYGEDPALSAGDTVAGRPGNRAARIGTMVARDRAIAIAFVTLLWLLIAFVLITMTEVTAQRGGQVVLIIAALVQVVFVTGAVVSLVKHASTERDRIYGPDLDHLDANRAAKGR
jgi:hypothetical protein